VVLRLLAVIPARGGSKSIPRKNIKPFAGKPLLSWTIDAALKVSKISRVIVSTDDIEISQIARRHGAEVPFLRPSELAQDQTAGVYSLLHALEQLPDFDGVLLLQPTSPLRTADDIAGLIDLALESGSDSIVSVSKVNKHPFWMYTIQADKSLHPFCNGGDAVNRRQDLPDVYSLNGAIYFVRSSWVLEKKTLIGQNTLGYVMPEERSIDIDTMFDWRVAEIMLDKDHEQ
jgi:CMP-N,N'-diacetyllegionaminic acid synthase